MCRGFIGLFLVFYQINLFSIKLIFLKRGIVTRLQDRNFPNTLIEMKRLAEESNRFRVEDVPPRLHEKEKIMSAFRDLERQMRDANYEMDRELHPESLERNWSQLMMLYQVCV